MEIMKKVSVCLGVIAALSAGRVFGYSWPSGTSVTIPSGTTADIAAGDLATVAGYTSITLTDSTSVISASDLGSPLNLNAAITGPGIIAVTNCNKLVLRGNNSGLTGCFMVYRTPTEIPSRYGLGGENTRPNHFECGENGTKQAANTIKFTGEGEDLTLDAPVYIDTYEGRIGADQASKTLVVRNDIQMTGSYKWLTLLSNVDLVKGEMGNRVGSSHSGMSGSGDIKLRIFEGGKYDSPHSSFFTYFPCIELYSTNTLLGNVKHYQSWGSPTIIRACCTNAFKTVYFDNQGFTKDRWYYDVNGFDQLVGKFQGMKFNIYSETPAWVRVISSNSTTYPNFMGAVNFEYDLNSSTVFSGDNAKFRSTSKGELRVTKGTLGMDAGWGWSGTNVTVSAATLNCNSAYSLTAEEAFAADDPRLAAAVVVKDAGTLSVADGVTIIVQSLKIGNAVVAAGENMAVADIVSTYGGDFDGCTLSGAGQVTVLPEPDQTVWTGWPESGVATIPVKTTVNVTAADLPRIANLDGITFNGQSSKVVFENLGDAIALVPPLAGDGHLEFLNCNTVTVSGVNSEFGGAMLFSNTECRVTSDYGLGREGAFGVTFWCVDDKRITFDNGTPVYTNNVSVKMYLAAGKTDLYFGADSLEKELVQNADFSGDYRATTYFHCRNTKFLKLFEAASHANSQYLQLDGGAHPSNDIDKGGHLWLLGTINVNAGIVYSGYQKYYNLHLGLKGKTIFPYWLMYSQLKTYGECENFLAGTQLARYQDFYLDLNGYSTDAPNVQHHNSADSTAADRSFVVTSPTPATFRLTGTQTHKLTPQFSGAAGFSMAGTGAYTFFGKSGKENDTTGELKVESGTLNLDTGFTWAGTNVTVTGGSLVVTANAAAAFPNGAAMLKVTGGTLTVKAGTAMNFRGAVFGETVLADGDYTVAQLRAMDGVAPFIGAGSDDEATISVDSEPAGEWTGWPAEGGAVSVPKNCTVNVAAGDLAKIALVTELHLGNNSKVVFTSLAEPMTLGFPVDGKGRLEFTDCGRVTITADNSGIQNPGGFTFTRTDVLVANRYGLGGAAAGECLVYTAVGADKELFFTGEAKTNDVAVTVDHGLKFGYDDATFKAFRQGGNFTQTAGSTSQNAYVRPQSSIAFGAEFRASCFGSPNNRELTFEEGSAWYGNNPTSYMLGLGNTYYLNAAMPAARPLQSLAFQSGFEVWFGADYAIDLASESGVHCGYLNSYDGVGIYHLEGHPQRVAALSREGSDSWPNGSVVTFDSPVPATFYIVNGYNNAAYAYNHRKAASFTGQVSLDFTGSTAYTVTQMFAKASCDTTGSLLVRRGNLLFTNGSYWGGTNVTVNGTGRLFIEGSCRTNSAGAGRFFGPKANLVLDVRNGAEVVLPAGRTESVRSLFLIDGEHPDGRYVEAGTVYPCGAGSVVSRRGTAADPGMVLFLR